MGKKRLRTAVDVFLLVACSKQSKSHLYKSGLKHLQAVNSRGTTVSLMTAREFDFSYHKARYHRITFLRIDPQNVPILIRNYPDLSHSLQVENIFATNEDQSVVCVQPDLSLSTIDQPEDCLEYKRRQVRQVNMGRVAITHFQTVGDE